MTRYLRLIPFFLILGFVSCADKNAQTERRPVPPKGSDESAIPWNDPGQGGTPGGQLGQMLDQRR